MMKHTVYSFQEALMKPVGNHSYSGASSMQSYGSIVATKPSLDNVRQQMRCHCNSSTVSLFSVLPLDLLWDLYSFLDHRSLNSLITAFPSIAHHFLLVTDEGPVSEPHMFKASGITHITLEEFYECKYRGTRLITLIEINEVTNLFSLRNFKDDQEKHSPLLSMLNSHCFVYLNNIAAADLKQMHRWRIALMPTHAKVLIEAYDYVAMIEGSIEQLASQHLGSMSFSRPKLAGFRTIKTLELGRASIVNGVELPALHQLSIQFHGSNTKFRNVKAKGLIYLNICYSGHFPLLENLDLGNADNIIDHAKDYEGAHHGLKYIDKTVSPLNILPILLITNMDTVYFDRRHPLPLCSTPLSTIQKSDFSFAKNFRIIHVNGGHDLILKKIDFSRVRSLKWLQTHNQADDNSSWTIESPHLAYLSYETVLSQRSFPTLKSDNLISIAVLSHNSGLDLSQLWNSSSFPFLRCLQIHVNMDKDDFRDESDFIFIERHVLTDTEQLLLMLILHGCIIDPMLARSFPSCHINYKTGVHCSGMGGTYKDIDNSKSFGEMISLPYE